MRIVLLSFVLLAWNGFRGPDRDGQVTGWPEHLTEAAAWPEALREVWRVPVGLGHASPILDGDSILLFAGDGGEEVLHRLRLEDGAPEWSVSQPAPYTMHPAATSHGPGPKSTPALGSGRVYTLGISGILTARNAASGALLWRQHRFPEAPVPLYGAGSSPLAHDGRVIAHLGGPGNGVLVALDGATGETVWEIPDAPAYASPALATVAGRPTLLTMTETRILLLAPEDGQVRWEMPFRTPYDQNIANPLVLPDGETVVFGGLDHPAFAVRFRAEGERLRGETAWEADRTQLYMSSPVRAKGRLFAFGERNSGQFVSFDPATGADIWRSPPRSGENAALLSHGGVVLALTDGAELLVFDAADDEYRPARLYQVAPSPTWAQPVPVPDGILIKDRENLTRFAIPETRR